mgnify:CR=1 FL=1
MEANKIIITGGATRIGAAIAKKLAGPGVEIVIHYNKSNMAAEKLKKEGLNPKLIIAHPGWGEAYLLKLIRAIYYLINLSYLS